MLIMLGRRIGLMCALAATLSACSGGSGSSQATVVTSSTTVVSGSVGDGPVVGATLTLTDAAGAVLQSYRSSDTADYRIELSAGTKLPVLVTATGGIDLVTDRALDFPLVGAVLAAGSATVNVSPLTTVAVRAAQCSASGLTAAGLQDAWRQIYQTSSLGLDPRLVADPMNDPVSATNVGTLVLANEALGEVVRRTMLAFEGAGERLDGEEVLRQFGCDLMADDRTGAVDPRVMAVFKAAELAVRLEKLAGRLEVDDYSATARMDQAIRTIRPHLFVPSVAVLPIPESAAQQAALTVGLWQGFAAEPGLVSLASLLASTPISVLGAQIDAALDPHLHGRLKDLPLRVALADLTEIQDLAARRAAQAGASAPILAFTASAMQVPAGTSVTLSWASSHADVCVAAGEWNGIVEPEGFHQTPNLQGDSQFLLTCAGSVGAASQLLMIQVGDAQEPVDPAPVESPAPESPPAPQPAPTPESSTQIEPAPEIVATPESTTPAPVEEPTPEPAPVAQPAPQPTVQLRADRDAVVTGESTGLTWSATDADSCSASGGWSGSRSLSGSETVGPLTASATFSLNCSGPGGSAMTMISVVVNGAVALRWQAPTKHVDGSPVTALAGFRVYTGAESGSYYGFEEISSDTDGEYSLMLSPGVYYLAMTAIGTDGQESAYSNEVMKVVD